ncbi:hypothetical protein N8703_03425 [Verrucomicrobia bacterium]|nr:hypothetical protein [Verrucomicrobiota bacterium]
MGQQPISGARFGVFPADEIVDDRGRDHRLRFTPDSNGDGQSGNGRAPQEFTAAEL